MEFPELKTETELKNRAKNAIDRVKRLIISIDSKKISNLANYRVRSDPFEVNFPEHNVFGVEPGITRAVSDGYWIMLKPLPPGKHTLHFGGEAYCQKEMLEFKTDVTYHLTFE